MTEREQRDAESLRAPGAADDLVLGDTFARTHPVVVPAGATGVIDAEAARPDETAEDAEEGARLREAAREDDGPRGSRLDEIFGRLVRTPRRLAVWNWGLPLAVTLLAAVLRLWNLGHPHTLVFDETFYVKDAWTLWNLGFEGAWPEDPDPGFASGDASAYTGAPSFVAHPPFGKWLIALGIAAFGVDDSFGWRVSTALAGILGVVVVMLITKKLFRSTLVAGIAGLLFAIDGHAITLARVSLLDNFLMIVTLLGVGAILLDRSWFETRFAQRMARGGPRVASGWGPVLAWRPWLLVAGVLFGLGAGVKWTGVYFLAAYGVYVVIVDILARRRAGLGFWASGGLLKQAPVSFLVLVPVAIASYLATWSGWLLTSGGYYRNWASEAAGNAWSGGLAWVPHWVQNLWHYHSGMYNYSINLRAEHPYSSSPLEWLFMIRPTSMFYQGTVEGEGGCTIASCSEAITSVANPLIWWAGGLALVYLLYRLVRFREWRSGFVLMGVVAGYLPWMLYLDRTVFQFYCIVFEPYMMIALAFTAKIALGSRTDPRARRVLGIRVVGVFLVLAVLISAFFYPLWTGIQVPYDFWPAHMWLPSWI